MKKQLKRGHESLTLHDIVPNEVGQAVLGKSEVKEIFFFYGYMKCNDCTESYVFFLKPQESYHLKNLLSISPHQLEPLNKGFALTHIKVGGRFCYWQII